MLYSMYSVIYNDINDFRINSIDERQTAKQICICSTELAPIFQGTDPIYSGWYSGLDGQKNERDYWIVYVFQAIGALVTTNMNAAIHLYIHLYYCFMIQIVRVDVNILGQRFCSVRTNGRISTFYARIELVWHIHHRINKNFEFNGKNLEWAYFCQVLLSGNVIFFVYVFVMQGSVTEEPLSLWDILAHIT
ncbi:uncharacterized protein LOC116339855 [Contarinia nasturtii]|uniref:uncharacterized protein LOC116339855 n=1 Tax=Contarinia nasturtii TaxID=265458 RepID=UPI0012D376F3|nr:uncharacterized protein LOC116339855 [Contarinia nasturtii]